EMVKRGLGYFYPLLRYSDIGFYNSQFSEENLLRFLDLNPDIKLKLFCIVGSEKVAHTIRTFNDLVKRHQQRIIRRPNCDLAIASIQRGEPATEALPPSSIEVVPAHWESEMPVSSSAIRNDPTNSFCPLAVLEFIAKLKLYERDQAWSARILSSSVASHELDSAQ
ncbi:MAG: hypothetical protein ABII23_09110, partial [bacterium]